MGSSIKLFTETAEGSPEIASEIALGTAPGIASWCGLLLEHLDEFAMLSWYLVADGKLVEETFGRAIERLDTVPFDGSDPGAAYNQVREILVIEAIAVVEATCRKEEAEGSCWGGPLSLLPDLARLAFLLRMVIRFPAIEVAKFLDVPTSDVRRLVTEAIDYLGVSVPCSLAEGIREAGVLESHPGEFV